MDLGLRLALGDRVETVGYVERDAYAASVLLARMEDATLGAAPLFCGDLRELRTSDLRGRFDLFSAGFPCQPFSTASRGRKVAVDLWPEVRRLIRETAPPVVFLENVARYPIVRARTWLRRLGYRAEAAPFDAAELGSPARRRRWFALAAHPDHPRESGLAFDVEVARIREAPTARRWRRHPGRVLGMAPRVPHRVDRLRLLGNVASPPQVALAWCGLAEALREGSAR